MPGHVPPFTIRHTTRSRVVSNGERIYHEEVRLMPGYGKTAEAALEGAIEELAEDDPRLDDLSFEDDEYETERACALDDVDGLFEVFEGDHRPLPEGIEPVLTDGELPDDLPVRSTRNLIAA